MKKYDTFEFPEEYRSMAIEYVNYKQSLGFCYSYHVKKEWWNIGITSIRTPFGGMVNIYNKERCICDFIRNKNDVDIQLFTQALKDYFKQKCDIRLLDEYGKVFGVDEKIRTYIEVLY
ncbi:MAG: hypothetical protein ACK5JH_10820 [Anaerocolumna sp.]